MGFFGKTMTRSLDNIRESTDACYNTAINRTGINTQKYAEAECHHTKRNLK